MLPFLLSILFSLYFYVDSLAAVFANGTNSTYDVFDYVDPLIGTANGGNVFGGATLPFGMAKAVADVNGDNQGGFATDGSNVTGFSTMHDSGTGGSPSLGNFPLFPYAACAGDDIDGCIYPKLARNLPSINSSVVATPGYFAIELESGVKVDMTVANRSSLFRFQFPSTPDNGAPLSPLILQDLTDLQDSRFNGSIAVDDSTGRMVGNATFLPSFGSGMYTLYFCTDFQGAAIRDTGIWVNSRATTDPKSLFITQGINGYPLPGGAFTRFEAPDSNNTILARVGTSFISNDQACSNAEAGIPDFDFAATQQTAEAVWRQQLSPISIQPDGASDSIQTIFWSGIYRTNINPQDYTGENPIWSSTEPYFDSFYCTWDLFRSQLPFLTILDPSNLARMVRAYIDIYVHQGYLPDCRMSLCKGFTQGGSNADNVLVDAYVKNVTAGIDYTTAYAAVVKDAEVEPIDWSNEGRGGLTSWKNLGYIPVEDLDYIGFGTFTRSISRTLEYGYNDFCISQLAQGLGNTADAEKYQGRSENWKNLWKADQTSVVNGTDSGFTGFPQPKYLNGTFGFQDPDKCANFDTTDVCSLQNNAAETFESSIWEYSFFVPGDMASLITYMGGPTTFVSRLDYLHESNIEYIGNEPAFLTVFQYHYAGRPGRSAYRSHFYIPAYFSDSDGGLPGNDDSGALGSFIAFSMMGLFPNPGQNVYLIIPPYFASVSITSNVTGKTATITNANFDPTYTNIYIQNATLDGAPYSKNWIDHSFFLEGKNLTLFLGPTESTSWGTADADLPPSLSTSGGANSTNGTTVASRRWEERRRGLEDMQMGRMMF